MLTFSLVQRILVTAVAAITLTAAPQSAPAPGGSIPRTVDGKPNLQGIWQASSSAGADLQDHAARNNMLAGRSVVVGGEIPYQPWAAAKKAENYKNRLKADPYRQCFLPGTPRIMYLDYPFQVFQTPQAIAMTFEWSLAYRLIPIDGQQASRRLRFLDGRFPWPLGERHSGGRRRQPQRQNVVGHGREFP